MRGGGDCDGRPTKTKWASDRGVNYSRDQANAPTPENPVSNRAQPEGPPQRHHGRTDSRANRQTDRQVYVSCSIRNHYTVCLRKQPQTARFQYGRRATRGACAEQDVERITFSRACELGGWCQAGLQVGKSREERLSKNKRNWSTEITKVMLTLTWPMKSALSPLNRQCAAMRARGGVAAGLAP